MPLLKLRAEDPVSGQVLGWRKHNAIVAERGKATVYLSIGQALDGLESAEKRWPIYAWRAFPRGSEVEQVLPSRPKRTFTRQEVLDLLRLERESCAMLCADEEQVRTKAGQAHPEESPSRDRCFAAARAAINCALAIRSERPPVEELLK